MKILEPNMYVRINNDIRTICIGIGKIKKIVSEVVYVDMRNDLPISFEINKIANASHNIVDLIECGDIIEVQEFKGKYEVKQYGLELSIVKDEYIYNLNSLHCKLNIKTIVTKQQFESMQYEVK